MARVTLVVAAFGAALVFLLAKLQKGDDLTALVLAAIMLLATLGAAALLHFRMPRSGDLGVTVRWEENLTASPAPARRG